MSKKLTSPAEMAYFRFALIAPVIQGTHCDVSAAAYFRRVTSKEVSLPDGTTVCYRPKTLEKWVQYYKTHGIDALMPNARSDLGSSRKLDESAICEIYRLKEKFPKLNATQIHLKLIQDGFLPASVSVSSVQRFVKKNDLKSARNINIKDRKAFEEEHFGALWQADTCYMPYITENGKKRRPYLIMIIDDHSRLIVSASIFYNDNSYNFQKVFKNGVLTYGIPSKLYVDNGSTYINDQLALICASIGTVKIHTPVRDGASKGKIERAFRTLKNRWIYGLDISLVKSLSDFNEMLSEYVRKQNLTVSSAIKEAPIDRFMRTKDHIRHPQSMEFLDLCFANRITRKVNNDSCISIDGIYYDAPLQFIGMKVDIRFLPDDMDNAYILYDNMKFPLRTTDKIANSKSKRNNFPAIDYSKKEGDVNV